MFNLFDKSKVKAGKQTQVPADKVPQKKQSPLAALSGSWSKLNSMNRKQAYTWGAVAVVGLVALLMLGSLAGSSQKDNFEEFESRGYDLANMPFSSDEAEQYLLASKYPDMQGEQVSGLYSPQEKAERQAEDAAEAAEADEDRPRHGDSGSYGRQNRSYGNSYSGGGRGGSGGRTQVNRLNSANLKGASGSGMSGSFGPTGDFSNFRSQDKGSDKAPRSLGGQDARKALFQAAVGSRAAAGQKENKLLNAKKAMMGGNVEGSQAFMNDSGAVDLTNAKGLNLDPNAPVTSADLSGLDDAIKQKADEKKKEEQKEEEDWLTKLWHGLAEQAAGMIVDRVLGGALDMLTDSVKINQQATKIANAQYAEQMKKNWESLNANQQGSYKTNWFQKNILGQTSYDRYLKAERIRNPSSYTSLYENAKVTAMGNIQSLKDKSKDKDKDKDD